MCISDSLGAFNRYSAKQEAWLNRQPKCEKCKEPIQDEILYDIDGALYCEECMKDLFRKSTDDYEREI